ncbi:DsbE family thiol:disulfide interchange protein [Roseovarius sp. EL26]|uniref:DsbE family thiol:disulfide interchange protein n=1 Tax=Roseovarius sp. EL26 TaxID=2126672 RepID=UPI000EA2A9B0|nr:DsbE family thiol:disulfide interchange protein [Roseovarius sp. EL26]
MAKISPLMLAPPLIFLAMASTFYVAMQRENPDELPSALAGKQAPAVQVEPFADAQLFADADLRDGQIKLVNYWASWCAPCRAEHPQLELLADEGVPIYGINYKDDAVKAAGFLAELGNPYVRIGSDNGRMALNWGVYGVPETYVIDGDGTILLRFAGPITKSILETTIRPALKSE